MTEEKTNAQEKSVASPAGKPSAAKAAAVTAKVPAVKATAAKKPAAAKQPATQAAAKPAAKPAAAKPAVSPAATAAAVTKARPAPRKRSPVDETVDKHQKVLADALAQAEAIKYDKPRHLKQAAKPVKAAKPAKAEKPAKAKKAKLVRDSFAMPENEYARIAELKKRLGGDFKKSELLRAGVAVLAALNDAELKAVMGRVERIKTGRPAKK